MRTIRWHLVPSRCRVAITSCLVPRCFHHPKKPCSCYAVTLLVPCPQSLAATKAPWICLFWMSHVNGIMQQWFLCVWLLLLSMMFLRFIHAVAGIRMSFLFKCSLSLEMGFVKPTEGFPGGSDGKVSAYNVGDLDSIPGSGRSPGEGNGNPLQYPYLENSMHGGSWWATAHEGRKEWDMTE